jgi:hypothetical protein
MQDPKGSTLLIPNPAIGHDPEPVSFLVLIASQKPLLIFSFHLLPDLPSKCFVVGFFTTLFIPRLNYMSS